MPDSERERRLDEIYSAALKQDASRRPEFLRQACGEDALSSLWLEPSARVRVTPICANPCPRFLALHRNFAPVGCAKLCGIVRLFSCPRRGGKLIKRTPLRLIFAKVPASRSKRVGECG